MAVRTSPSALVVDKGRRVLLRLPRGHYDVTQQELRSVLGVLPGPPGLGITIDRNRFYFDFADDQSVEISAGTLARRLAGLGSAQ
jgi:hypothetical protein